MPTYTYLCESCKKEFVEQRMMDERDIAPDCPKCGGNCKRKLDRPNYKILGTKKGNFNSNADGVKVKM